MTEIEIFNGDKRKFELPGSNGRSGLSRRNNDVVSQMKKLQTWSSQHSTFTASDNSAAILVCTQLILGVNFDDSFVLYF